MRHATKSVPLATCERTHRTPRALGFTLIELLVVISIIAILIGILVPALSMARGSVKKITCSSALRQLGLSMEMYTGEHKDLFPQARYMPEPFASSSPHPPITDALDDYLDQGKGDASVYKCPDDEQVYDLAGISYEYTFMIGGKSLDDMMERGFLKRMGVDESKLAVLRDFDNGDFLLNDGTTITELQRHIGRNILFADGHVGKLEF